MYDDSFMILKVFLIVACCIACGMAIIFISYGMNEELSTLNDAKKLAATDEYTTYLDGQEIDFSNIDPEKYSITIDYENHKIILTSRSSSRRNLTTIYVPPVHY